MTSSRFATLLLGAVFCSLIFPVKTTAGDVITLNDAVNRALKNNHYIKAKNYGLMAA